MIFSMWVWILFISLVIIFLALVFRLIILLWGESATLYKIYWDIPKISVSRYAQVSPALATTKIRSLIRRQEKNKPDVSILIIKRQKPNTEFNDKVSYTKLDLLNINLTRVDVTSVYYKHIYFYIINGNITRVNK